MIALRVIVSFHPFGTAVRDNVYLYCEVVNLIFIGKSTWSSVQFTFFEGKFTYHTC